jgi:hypothetical protein
LYFSWAIWSVIFCLPVYGSALEVQKDVAKLTITAGLNRSLNVADALNRHAVLVVAVDILVLQLTNLVDQDTELICDVRNVVVTSLAPDGKLLL